METITTKNIEFTEETYKNLKDIEKKKEWDPVASGFDGFLGYIRQGAVCCDLNLIEDAGFEDEEYCFGGRFVIDAKFFLLGVDAGYGSIKEVPYDCVSGFYGTLEDTYEETLKELVAVFDECVATNNDLVAAVNNTELTWDKVASYNGEVYPGYETE